MIIAIALKENSLQSEINSRFGRSPWIGLYNILTREVAFIENSCAMGTEGAGLNLASQLISQGVQKVVAGGFGPAVTASFSGKRIQMIIPAKKDLTMEQLISRLNAGRA